MNTKTILTSITLCAAVLAFSGCKKEEPTEVVTETVVEESTDIGSTLKDAGETVKASAEQAATEVKEQAQSAASEATAKAQELIDQAKAFITDKKYTEALNSIQGLSDFKLTPEQQKIVDDLKAQIQKGMTALKMP